MVQPNGLNLGWAYATGKALKPALMAYVSLESSYDWILRFAYNATKLVYVPINKLSRKATGGAADFDQLRFTGIPNVGPVSGATTDMAFTESAKPFQLLEPIDFQAAGADIQIFMEGVDAGDVIWLGLIQKISEEKSAYSVSREIEGQLAAQTAMRLAELREADPAVHAKVMADLERLRDKGLRFSVVNQSE